MKDSVPSAENMRCFMLFDGTPSVDSLVFDGSIDEFSFFSDPTWESIVEWAKDQGYTVVMDDTELYQDLTIEIDGAEDYFDAAGNVSVSGLYDAGGHPISERWADFADHLHDEFKYRE